MPRPLRGRHEPDFSLSGLKTALRLEAERIAPLSERDIADLCASFQLAIVEIDPRPARAGLRVFRERYGKPTALVAAGGVAANQAIRKVLQRLALQSRHRAGRAAAGALHRQWRDDRLGRCRTAGAGLTDPLELAPRARWPLEEIAGAAQTPQRRSSDGAQ